MRGRTRVNYALGRPHNGMVGICASGPEHGSRHVEPHIYIMTATARLLRIYVTAALHHVMQYTTRDRQAGIAQIISTVAVSHGDRHRDLKAIALGHCQTQNMSMPGPGHLSADCCTWLTHHRVRDYMTIWHIREAHQA